MSIATQMLKKSIVAFALANIMSYGCGSESARSDLVYSNIDRAYTLWIREYSDNVILGSHCFVLYGGNLIDCSETDAISIVMLRDDSGETQQNYRMLLASEYRETVAMLNVRYSRDTIQILTNDTSLLYETANVLLMRRDTSER